MRGLFRFALVCVWPVGAFAGPTSEEFFRPYASGYAGSLAACIRHLEADGGDSVFKDWEAVEPPKPVCQDGFACHSVSKPVVAWTVVHHGAAEDRPFCFGAWTATLNRGSQDVVKALNGLTARAVEADRLTRIPPQPDWVSGPTLSIAEVYQLNSPPLGDLKSFLGCSASAIPFVVSLYLNPERLVRFEAQHLPPDKAAVWRKDAPCVAIVS